MFNKVFISYAREDFNYADKLYDFLSQNGFEPWMDKKKILAGQNWDFHIQQGLQKADFIVILLSSNSVGKRGYVQRELNQAIIYCEEKLDSDIYVIPVKIDTCEIPEKVSKFQWVEYLSDESMNQILTAINFQRDTLIQEIDKKKYRIAGFDYEEESISGRYGNRNPYMIYEFHYPVFKDNTTESLKELNIIIQNSVVSGLISIRNNYFKFVKYLSEPPDPFEEMDSTEYSTINFSLLNNSFVSYTHSNSSYSTGAAHGNFGSLGCNYYINPVRSFKLEDLFENFENCLVKLRDCVHNKLMLKAKNDYEEDVSEYFYIYDEGFQAIKENFENYYFKDKALVFIYNPYELTAWSMGDHHPEITFDELLKIFPDESKLHEFINTISLVK